MQHTATMRSIMSDFAEGLLSILLCVPCELCVKKSEQQLKPCTKVHSFD
jgi:hypothetical protein